MPSMGLCPKCGKYLYKNGLYKVCSCGYKSK